MKKAVHFKGVAYLSLKKKKKEKRWRMKSYGLPKWIHLKCKMKSRGFFFFVKVWSERKGGLQLGFGFYCYRKQLHRQIITQNL